MAKFDLPNLENTNHPTRGVNAPKKPESPTPEPIQEPTPEQDESGVSGKVIAGVAVGALVLFGGIGALVLGGGSDEPVDEVAATADPAEESTDTEEPVVEDIPDGLALGNDEAESPVEPEGEVVADDAPDASAPDQAAPDQEAPVAEAPVEEDVPEGITREAVIGPDSPATPEGAPENHSIISEGKIYFRGRIDTEANEAFITSLVEASMGEGNVVSELSIDPSFPFDLTNSAVYIADKVLFESGSAELTTDLGPILGPGVITLETQPNVIIEAYGHTDSEGDEAANLALSQARVDVIRDWFISQGADGSRVVAVGFGEAEPVADNGTAEGRAQNRRVEFAVKGFGE